ARRRGAQDQGPPAPHDRTVPPAELIPGAPCPPRRVRQGRGQPVLPREPREAARRQIRGRPRQGTRRAQGREGGPEAQEPVSLANRSFHEPSERPTPRRAVLAGPG